MGVFMIKKAFIIGLIILIQFSFNLIGETSKIQLLNEDWFLNIDLSNYKIKKNERSEKDKYLNILAMNENTGYTISIYFEPHSNGNNSLATREYYINNLNKSPLKRSQEKKHEESYKAIYEYLIEEYNGVPLNQKNINIYIATNNIWIDIHISKVLYTKEDENIFNNFINSISIEKKASSDFFSIGSHYFLNGDYNSAINFYNKSFELEKNNRTLNKNQYYVLIDNLGMSYGITGDFQNSIKIYDFGISIDPNYPNFYYSLACCYAEMNNIDKCLGNLENALKNKKNVLNGEKFPNPNKDNSLKKYKMDTRFKDLLKKYK